MTMQRMGCWTHVVSNEYVCSALLASDLRFAIGLPFPTLCKTCLDRSSQYCLKAYHVQSLAASTAAAKIQTHTGGLPVTVRQTEQQQDYSNIR